MQPVFVINQGNFANQTTLSGIKAQTDLLTFTGNQLNTSTTVSVTSSVSGQQPMAQSQSMVLASDHLAIEMSGVVNQGNPGNDPWLARPQFSTRTDYYTAVATGVSVNVANNPMKCFSMQIKGSGVSANAWEVRLEGSLDGNNYASILQHTNTTGDGEVLYTGASLHPSLYFRSRVVSLNLGSAAQIAVTILGQG
ncbi:hypothetical protein HY496_02485 [Candidatus Woesearchaeota archaeon]|nr:hypothetical protein [Candidatus Woesearchaeota archaeon]